MSSQEVSSPPKLNGENPFLLQARSLIKHYPLRRGLLHRATGTLRAVDGVDLELSPGETLGLVGESGSGKSTLARLLMGLEEPTSGTVHLRLQGGLVDFGKLRGRDLAGARRTVQMVFQNPASSMNPHMSIREIIAEPLRVQGLARGQELKSRVQDLLVQVGLLPRHGDLSPRALSGGQLQRVGIARALALKPRLLIADEPVSALDVSVQSQVLNLLMELRESMGLSCIFIAHNLHLVRCLSHRIAVLYLGRVVEVGPAQRVSSAPLHPYTQGLLDSIPVNHPAQRRRGPRALAGEIPDAAHPPSGCVFHPRCAHAQARCQQEAPTLREISQGHRAACHYAEAIKATASRGEAP